MKYYSEVLNKTFNSEQECKEAENSYLAKKQDSEKTKKALVKEIEAATQAIKEADDNYDNVLVEVKHILDESNKKCEDMLKEASEKTKKAKEHKLKLINEFNNKYGVYTTYYTGEEAVREYNNFIREIDNFSKFFPFFR